MKALTNIGHRHYQLGEWDEAERWSCEALKAGGGEVPYAWSNLSAVAVQCGEVERAVEYAERAGDGDAVVRVQRGLALLNAGRWSEGLGWFEARFEYRMREFLSYPYPRWDGGRVERLFVVAEQGLGDTLSFSRFVPLLRGRVGSVVFGVQAELRGLMEMCLPGVEVVGWPVTDLFPMADAFVPVMSLPVALGLGDGEIGECPSVVPAMRPSRIAGPGAVLRVGVSWAGSAANDHDKWRSVPVDLLLALAAIPGVEVHALQAGPRAAELHSAGGVALIRDRSAELVDAAATLRVLNGLDLVVTVDSFLAHLAGAAGVPCWVMVSRRAGDWRLGRSGDRAALWYPGHTMFRQAASEGWEQVVKRVEAALEVSVQLARSGGGVPGRGASGDVAGRQGVELRGSAAGAGGGSDAGAERGEGAACAGEGPL